MLLIKTWNGIENTITDVNHETKKEFFQKTCFVSMKKMLLTQIVSNHPAIESENHATTTEQKKKSGWAIICSEFSAN